MNKEKTILKVWKIKATGQLLITVPRDKFKKGDYLQVKLVED